MVNIEINQDYKDFLDLVKRSEKKVGDLRPALESMAIRWFRSNKAIFSLKSKGGYEDLTTNPFLAFWQNKNGFAAYYAGGYKEYKEVNIGFVYPILKSSGRLEKSLTDMRSSEAIKQFIGKNSISLGTEVPYAHWLQDGTKKMASRPPVLLGAEKEATTEQSKNISEWSRILRGFVGESIGENWK